MTASVNASESSLSKYIGIGISALAVYLAWQICQTVIVDRLPPELALRLAPSSAIAIQRASEAAFTRDQFARSERLAKASLRTAPFSVRALRIVGLTTAESGNEAQADELLTLAGNWSLRDDASHAWLVDRRLRQGSYASAFAHAETLVRRRTGSSDNVLDLFITASMTDNRAIGPLKDMLERRPLWRGEFWSKLLGTPGSDDVLASIALSLHDTPGQMSSGELQLLYEKWLGEGRFEAIRFVSTNLSANTGVTVADGGFDTPADRQTLPVGWELGSSTGVSAEIATDLNNAENSALRTSYSGYGGGFAARQLIFLRPGRHTMRGRFSVEDPSAQPNLRATIRCAETRQDIADHSMSLGGDENGQGWHAFSKDLIVPITSCSAQWLFFEPSSSELSSRTAVWLDDIQVSPTTAP